jgi:hypothetical protein
MIPLKDNAPKEGTPFILWILVAINGLVFLFEDSLSRAALGRFIRLYAVVPARYHLFPIGLPSRNSRPIATGRS